jgi:hypothetical protein
MLQPHQLEELLCLIAAMDRPTLVRQLRNYPATFPLDFTEQFLQTTPIDRLRHIFLAVCLQCQQMPEVAAEVPAPHAA